MTLPVVQPRAICRQETAPSAVSFRLGHFLTMQCGEDQRLALLFAGVGASAPRGWGHRDKY